MNGGVEHVVAVDANGTVWNWGENDRGQLGNGAYVSTSVPQKVALPTPAIQVAAGQYYTMALSSDGQRVYAWGDNRSGELGIGATSPMRVNTPQQVKISLQAGQSIVSIADGGNGGFALLSNGQVYGWGANEHGQAGQIPSPTVATPAIIAGLSNVTALSAGDHQTLALKSDGTVWALGANRFGQLGPNGPKPTITSRTNTPVQVGGLPPIKAVATGGEGSFALDTQGNVWSWGRNAFGQLGQGTIDANDGPHPIPGKVPGLTGIVSISGEGPFTIAADAAGNVYAWGFDQNGEVGNGTLNSTGTPQLVLPAGKLGQPVVVMAGHWFSYAYNPTTGHAYAWGRNSFGELRMPGPKRNNPNPIDLGQLLPLCFATGTRIRTRRGDVPVESLVVGDVAVTAGGISLTIRWLGRRDLRPAEHAIPGDVWPVRVRAGAFGGSLPARDLWLSPGHPVLVSADGERDAGGGSARTGGGADHQRHAAEQRAQGGSSSGEPQATGLKVAAPGPGRGRVPTGARPQCREDRDGLVLRRQQPARRPRQFQRTKAKTAAATMLPLTFRFDLARLRLRSGTSFGKTEQGATGTAR